jgi:mannose-6-phosphate isomerase
MHLFEALLALYEASGRAENLARAERIQSLFAARFFDVKTHALREYCADDWSPLSGQGGDIVEPGHEFEWCWLLHRFSRLKGAAVHEAEAGLIEHAERCGVSQRTGAVLDEISKNGAPQRESARLWPQTERLRANIVRFECDGNLAAAAAAVAAYEVIRRYLDTPIRGLWRDRLLPDGSFVAEPAPASSFYHLMGAFAELIRIAEDA